MRLVSTIALAGLTACALNGGLENQYDYRDWDLNSDRQLTYDEFDLGFGDSFERWDADGDGRIDTNDFARGVYTDWDEDGDGMLSEGEFREDFFVGDLERYSSFDDWDIGGDGQLSQEEFVVGWRSIGAFDAWDLNDDSYLERYEVGRGLYDTWDADGTGILTRDEWGFRY